MDWNAERVGAVEGLRVWRIEKLELKEVLDEGEIGSFYSGDCYIILKTIGAPVPKAWNIHFWIGDESSIDEQFCAAYRTVEMDDFLGGRATQFRESQHFESKQFLALFPARTVRYLSGGVDSALRSTEESQIRAKRLFKVKGRKNCRVIQVPTAFSSLNQGDVFVLDAGDGRIFVWNGPHCNAKEKVKGAAVARAMRDSELAGRARIEFIEEEWDSHSEFFGLLNSRPLPPCSPLEEDDEAFERKATAETKLFRVSDASGALVVSEVAPPLGKHSLDSDDCFFLDVASSGIFVWMGKGCTPNERREVWTRVTEYLRDLRLPPHTPICKVNEGQEPAVFRAALNWPEDIPKTLPDVRVETQRTECVYVDELHNRKEAKVENVPLDVSGEKRVWRIKNFALEEVPSRDYGIFYTGDSYVVLHQSERANIATIYFWLGRESSIDEKASAALFAMRIDETETDGRAVQKRVIETKEPRGFLALFDDCFITFLGGHLSGFRGKPTVTSDTVSEGADRRRLFQIKEMRVGEVFFRADRLNSNDIFVALSAERAFAWIGKGANELEARTLGMFADRILENVVLETIHEGEEPEAFWDFLGGKLPYASTPALTNPTRAFAPRLFHTSNAKGSFRAEEIVDFSQEDLESEDVMILDTTDEIFVWIGCGSNEIEKKLALKLATEYVSSDRTGRLSEDTAMWVVKEGAEPMEFRAQFPAWRESLQDRDSVRVTVAAVLECYSKCCSLQELLVESEKLPFGVDATRKEEHLHAKDFERVFKMTKSEFKAMKKWKQIEAKKRVGLF